MLLHPYARVKLHTNLKVASANLDLHVAELADGAEAAALLPQAAHRLIAHSRLTVSKRAAVSLKESRRYTNLISPEHCWDFYLFYVYISFTNVEAKYCSNPQITYFGAGGVIVEVAVISVVGHG